MKEGKKRHGTLKDTNFKQVFETTSIIHNNKEAKLVFGNAARPLKNFLHLKA